MKKLKTIKDLENMKNTPNNIFGTFYNYLIEDLYNNEISKLNGSERNKRILDEYDAEAKATLLSELDDMREETIDIDLFMKMHGLK